MVDGVHERAARAVELLGIDVPEVPERAADRCTSARRSRSPARPPTSPTWRPAHERALGEWAQARARQRLRGRARATRPRNRAFYSHPDPEDPHWSPLVRPDLPRRRAGQRRPAAAPVRRLRARARASAATPTRRTRRTSRPSGAASRRTAASRSGWSGGSAGWSRRRTSARSRCSRATCTGSRPDVAIARQWCRWWCRDLHTTAGSGA